MYIETHSIYNNSNTKLVFFNTICHLNLTIIDIWVLELTIVWIYAQVCHKFYLISRCFGSITANDLL